MGLVAFASKAFVCIRSKGFVVNNKIWPALVFALLFAAAGTLLADSKAVLAADDGNAGPARLFILSGQSNMVGLNPRDTFIPELEAAFPDHRIVVVKDAENGQPIGRWWKKGTTRDLYRRLMKAVDESTQGQTFDSVTFVWMQGEADARVAASALYAENLKGLIQQVRTDLNRPDLTAVIGRISDHQVGNPEWDGVRAAQVNVANDDPLAGWIDTDDLNGDDDNLHYRPLESRHELGLRFARHATELLLEQSAQPEQP